MTRYWERREDTSCTTHLCFDDHGCTASRPEVRASLHERRRDPASGQWRVSATPGPGSVEAVALEPSWKSRVAQWQAVCQAARGMICRLTTTRMHRSFRNNEGVAFARCWTWTDIAVSCKDSHAEVVDGVENLADVPRRVRSCIEELLEHRNTAGRRRLLEAPEQVHLLLPPTEAGALFHELIGHGAEDGWYDLVPGARLGPGSMRVVVRHPWSVFCDDEGVRTHDIELVADGCLTGVSLADRVSVRVSAGRAMDLEAPSGLAVAAIHGEQPRLRCARMVVQGRGERVHDVVSGAGRVLRCTGVAGAEFHGGVAFVAARGGDMWEGGNDTGARVGPFLFRVSLHELAGRLVALPGEVMPTRARPCVKARDPLPACNEAPHALLADVQVTALPDR